jgi:hypothetical protein
MKLYNANPKGADHIRETVPLKIQANLKALIDLAQTDLINDLGCECVQSNETIEPISGVGYDGFMPWQDGGYELTAYYRNECDASFHFCAEQTEFNTAIDERAHAEFYADNNINPLTEYDDLTDDQQHDLDELESNLFEDAPVSFYAYAKDGNIILRLAINFRDAEYGREKYEHVLKEKTIKYSTFARCKALHLQAIIADFKK